MRAMLAAETEGGAPDLARDAPPEALEACVRYLEPLVAQALLRLLATPGWLKTPASLKRTMLTKPAKEVECRVRAHLLQSGNRRRKGGSGMT